MLDSILLYPIIALLIALVFAFIIFKITKKILKTVFLALSFIIVIGIILTAAGVFMTIDDVKDFQANFPKTPSTYLFEKDGKLLAGFKGMLAENPPPEMISQNQLAAYQSSFENKDLAAIKGESYKLFIISSSAFDSLESVPIGENEKMTKEQLLSLLDSQTPMDDYISIMFKTPLDKSQKDVMKEAMLQQLSAKDSAGFKGMVFFIALAASIQQQGPLFLFDSYREGRLTVYPETIIFKTIKVVPSFASNKLIEQIGG